MGLPIFESDLWDQISEGDEIEVDGDAGVIQILSHKADPVRTNPIPPFMQQLIEDGGLMKHIAKK
jgi:3-isopropylmalate/(R)-2-methylmalate dehydratase small subunit